VCESDAHLLDLVSNRIRQIDGVRETDTLMYLKLQQQTYAWGVR
jgi:Lrp/AsnC family transcriptional regulator for asnA, asnC and gidA